MNLNKTTSLDLFRIKSAKFITSLKEEAKTRIGPFLKPFAILSVLLLISYTSILLANFNYVDDMGRVVEGYQGWDAFSRYTSVFLSNIIHTDSFLADISPLPQFLAILEMSLAGILTIYIISGRHDFPLITLIAVIPLAVNPFFLECISYKYDAPYMALSVLASIFPFLFMNAKRYIYFLWIFFCMVIMCTTYQAASGIFPILLILVTFQMWMKGKDARSLFIFFGLSILAYVVGILFFKMFIMAETTRYVSNSLPPILEILPNAFHNLKKYWLTVIGDFKLLWLVIALLIVLSFLYICIRDSKRNKIATVLISILTLTLMGLFTFGLYPFLEETLFAPRAMYGVGALLAFIATFVATSAKALPAKILTIAFTWCMVVFSFAYGNALYVQGQWIDFRTTELVTSLSDIKAFSDNKQKKLQLEGDAGFSPALTQEIKEYPVLKDLIPRTLRGDWYWGNGGLMRFYGLKNVEFLTVSSSNPDAPIGDLREKKLPLIKETMYQDIYGDDTNFLVKLK